MDSKRTTIALNGAIYLFMVGVGLITPLLPGKILSYSHSTLQVGWLASAFACSYILVQVPVGMLADRLGYKYFLTLGFLFCGVAGITYLTAGSSSSILAGRFIQGIGEAPLWALAPALLSIINPTQKARAIGWYNASLHLGLTSGSIFGIALHGLLTEKQHFMLFISLCMASCLWIFFSIDDNNHIQEKAEPKSRLDHSTIFSLAKNRTLLVVLLGISVYGLGYGIFLTVIPSFLLANNNFSHSLVGLFFIGFYISISLAQLIGGQIADRWGRTMPMIVGLSFFSFGQLIFPYARVDFSIAFLSLSSFGLGLFLVGSLTMLNDQAGEKSKGLISGVFYLFWGCGYFFGPLLLGYMAEHGLYVEGFNSIGIMGGIVLISLLVSTRNQQKPQHILVNE